MYRINLNRQNARQRVYSNLGFKISATSSLILFSAQVVIFLFLIINYIPGTFLISLEWFIGNQLFRLGFLIFTLFLVLHFAAAERWKSMIFSELVLVLFIAEVLITTPVFKPGNTYEEFPLRVLTVNNAHKNNVESWLEYCVNNSVDIAGIQEVDSELADSFAKSAKRSGYNFRYTEDYPRANSGLVILSKGAILETKSLMGPSAYESPLRSSLYVTTQIQSAKIHLICAHLEPVGDPPGVTKYPKSWRKRYEQSKLLAETISEKEGYVIILGDFNATPTDRSIRPLKRALKDAWKQSGFGFGGTWPGDFPLFRIDYILHRNFSSSENARIFEAVGSDHQAFQVDLVW